MDATRRGGHPRRLARVRSRLVILPRPSADRRGGARSISCSELRRIPVVAGLAVAVALGGHSALSTAAGTRTITVKDDVFSPKKVTVSKNTLVTWRWAPDSDAHNVVSQGTRKFTSSKIKESGVHRFRFKKAGTYKYACTLHYGMTGQVIVR